MNIFKVIYVTSFIILNIYIIYNYKTYNRDIKLKFISYTSSKLETEWLNIIKLYEYNYTAKYCSLVHPFYKRLEVLQNEIRKCKNLIDQKCEGVDLSFFTYKYRNLTILKEYIEPLFGILRNTFAICYNRTKGSIISKDYLLPSYINAINKQIVYLDAGASTFYSGDGGSSQSYFYDFYKKYPSIKFKKWFLWEAQKQNISKIMNEIPIDIFAVYNYYNKAIVTDINSKNNPLQILKDYINNSYIIFKLDIDTPEVEIPILDYLLNNNDIIPDEFYFEYHYYSPFMMKWWGRKVDYNCSLYCAISKFMLLRKKGIRSHPWV